jgi:hypothetical protein
MAGMLYSLVALGFVLIYKASGVQLRAGRDGAVRGAGDGALCRMDSRAWTGIENPMLANVAPSCWPAP